MTKSAVVLKRVEQPDHQCCWPMWDDVAMVESVHSSLMTISADVAYAAM